MNRRAVLGTTAGLVSLSGCLFGGGEDEIDGHESGDLEIVIDGEPVDLGADRFQAENADDHSIRFHFHEGSDQWSMEEERVTFAEAIDLIPHFAYEQTDGERVLTYDGTVYDGGESGTEIVFVRNGETVDPTEHDLQDGDDLRVEVETEA